MGGHGALVIALRNPDAYRQRLGLCPHRHAERRCPGGKRRSPATSAPTAPAWRQWDASALVRAGRRFDGSILVDQGTADKFLDEAAPPRAVRDRLRGGRPAARARPPRRLRPRLLLHQHLHGTPPALAPRTADGAANGDLIPNANSVGPRVLPSSVAAQPWANPASNGLGAEPLPPRSPRTYMQVETSKGTMRAIVLPEYGPPSALQLRTLPNPQPGAKEILVRMAGASLNPVDWKQRSGALRQYMPLDLPAVLGRDASGTVAAVGPGVTEFAVGDKVLGRVMGGYAELVVAPVDAWALVPAKLDLADAGALPLVVLTGAQLAEDATDARAGGDHPGHGRHRRRGANDGVRSQGARREGLCRRARQAQGRGRPAGGRRGGGDRRRWRDRQAADARRNRRHRGRRDDPEAAREAQAGRQARQRAR